MSSSPAAECFGQPERFHGFSTVQAHCFMPPKTSQRDMFTVGMSPPPSGPRSFAKRRSLQMKKPRISATENVSTSARPGLPVLPASPGLLCLNPETAGAPGQLQGGERYDHKDAKTSTGHFLVTVSAVQPFHIFHLVKLQPCLYKHRFIRSRTK